MDCLYFARQQAEGTLRLSEERLTLLLQGVKDYAIFTLDPMGLVATWNEGATHIEGYSAAEIIGQHFSKFCRPEDVAQGLARAKRHFPLLGQRSNYRPV